MYGKLPLLVLVLFCAFVVRCEEECTASVA